MRIDARAARALRRLDASSQDRILAFLRRRIATDNNPRRIGKPLTGPRTGLWRYRVGDHRLICRIEDEHVVVLILRIAHRREAYRR